MGTTSPSRTRIRLAAAAAAGVLLTMWTTPAISSPTAHPVPAHDVECVKVSANEATEAELTAAFESVDIPDAERWADEVVEYRPYPADDPTLGKLRLELAKYEPSPEVLEHIVSCLSLP